MRVLFVSNLYPPNVVGGYERLCFEVTSAFAARGHDVRVLASGHGGGAAEYPGQTIRRTLRLLVGEEIYDPFPGDAAARDAVNRGNLDALRDSIAGARPDVVFAWNLFFLDRSFLAALGACGLPVYVMLTDNWLLSMERPHHLARFFHEHVFGRAPFPLPTPPPPAPPPLGVWGRLRSLVRPAAPGAAPPPAAPGQPAPLRFPFGAVFGAAFVRELYADAGVFFERSRVVHNGVHQRPRPDAAFRDRARLVQDGELRLLFAGRFVDLKGAHDAVAAMPLIRPEEAGGVRRVRLTLLGDTRDAAYAERLRREVAANPCADQIEILPPVAEDALFDLFQQHDIYLFPSLYEPFSLTLIHALACGIPTAASRAGGNVEIVRDGESGVLFEKGDPADLARAVLRLARDPALRAGVSARGRAAASRFTFESMVDGMEAFLREGMA
jgi:glycogen synthase